MRLERGEVVERRRRCPPRTAPRTPSDARPSRRARRRSRRRPHLGLARTAAAGRSSTAARRRRHARGLIHPELVGERLPSVQVLLAHPAEGKEPRAVRPSANRRARLLARRRPVVARGQRPPHLALGFVRPHDRRINLRVVGRRAAECDVEGAAPRLREAHRRVARRWSHAGRGEVAPRADGVSERVEGGETRRDQRGRRKQQRGEWVRAPFVVRVVDGLLPQIDHPHRSSRHAAVVTAEEQQLPRATLTTWCESAAEARGRGRPSSRWSRSCCGRGRA